MDLIDNKSGETANMDMLTLFETLTPLPIALSLAQCVVHKHEILICGGNKRNCFSYHTHKNQYKPICLYPDDVELFGHCVVEIPNNKNNNDTNTITLLSFGGQKKHTLIMKYRSVWSNDENGSVIKKTEKHYNEWVSFTDNENKPISIGKAKYNYCGVRAVIDGSNNHLLFIIYPSNGIDVFDLNALQYVKYDTLPPDCGTILFPCFISIKGDESATNNNTKKKNIK
ncbi:hypothetical protein RFI_27810 [Reticulomyxa filosa]|uniref:Uncharacterized protein n=1 Tax=Reticulomyxa filosa TaxID=46433 RepID=X6M6M5_RETFI|nr:hypothetical protein RFI_27810 [Reticulomyxa filosa]|eukprot:ETO09564.1 hypothetical protein RFI_27810 [Reticulomyxa filosa]